MLLTQFVHIENYTRMYDYIGVHGTLKWIEYRSSQWNFRNYRALRCSSFKKGCLMYNTFTLLCVSIRALPLIRRNFIIHTEFSSKSIICFCGIETIIRGMVIYGIDSVPSEVIRYYKTRD